MHLIVTLLMAASLGSPLAHAAVPPGPVSAPGQEVALTSRIELPAEQGVSHSSPTDALGIVTAQPGKPQRTARRTRAARSRQRLETTTLTERFTMEQCMQSCTGIVSRHACRRTCRIATGS